MAHQMLSELYGRIGQLLREHGDAPIGKVRRPLFPEDPHIPIDYVEPIHCTFTHVETEIDGVKINTYEPNAYISILNRT